MEPGLAPELLLDGSIRDCELILTSLQLRQLMSFNDYLGALNSKITQSSLDEKTGKNDNENESIGQQLNYNMRIENVAMVLIPTVE